MRWNRVFWPLVLIVLGGMLLLSNFKLITFDIWGVFVPVVLILLGLSVLLGSLQRASRGVAEALTIPLEGVEKARLRVKYGAGRVKIGSLETPGQFLSGSFEGGVEDDVRRDGATLDVELRATGGDGPFWWDGGRREWSFGLSKTLPMALDMDMGAAETRLDLTEVKVTDLRLKTGASSTNLTMPASAGLTTAHIEGGAASVDIRIPAEVATRIRWEGGLASISVDTNRFAQSGNTYESKDFDRAKNKIDLKIDMGVGSVSIR